MYDFSSENEVVVFITAYKIHNENDKMNALAKVKNKAANIFKLNPKKVNRDMSKYNLLGMYMKDFMIYGRNNYFVEYNYDSFSGESKLSAEKVGESGEDNDFSFPNWFLGVRDSMKALFNINNDDGFIMFDFENFKVSIDTKEYGVFPMVFTINNAFMVNYILIDCETNEIIKKDEIYSKRNDFNIIETEKHWFKDGEVIIDKIKISDIILYNIIDYLNSSFDTKRNGYSFVHSSLVLTKELISIEEYFTNKLNVNIETIGDYGLRNLSTVSTFEYYSIPSTGVGIISDNVEMGATPLYDLLILESLKASTYLKLSVSAEVEEDLEMIIKNNIALDKMLSRIDIPIMTINLFNSVKNGDAFKLNRNYIDLKIAEHEIENQRTRKTNNLVMNILLYILTFLGSIGTLEILDNQLKIPFNKSFWIITIIFTVAGIAWIINEVRDK